MTNKTSSMLMRSLAVLQGKPADFDKCLQDLYLIFKEDMLVLSSATTLSKNLPLIKSKQASEALGQEKSLIVVDCYTTIHADAIAAISGLVVGGGLLLFLVPSRDIWAKHYIKPFSQRFIQMLAQYSSLHFYETDDVLLTDKIKGALQPSTQLDDIQLTNDQQSALIAIDELLKPNAISPLIINSDRGRGKSTLLGCAAAQLIQQQEIKIILVAPSFKACAIAWQYALKQLDIQKSSHAEIKLNNALLKFMAPDELLQSDEDADLLIIDEAAAIPLAIIDQLLQRFTKVVMATTVHGYEGTGRGFYLRFMASDKTADVNMKNTHELNQPVRWVAGDELEKWLFKWLCLDAALPVLPDFTDATNLEYTEISRTELMQDESLLRQIIALLVLAHYRTRPSDLQRLLNDPMVITIARQADQIVGVCLSLNEGEFEPALCTQVYRGNRRIKGHLLAQSLSYHCGVEHAAEQKIHRIMRIVVHPLWQSRHIGSELLTTVVNNARLANRAVIGASFGLTEKLNRFWKNNNFELIRVGFKREKTSGEHAAMFVMALNEIGQSIVTEASQRFNQHYEYLQNNILKDLDYKPNIKKVINKPEMTAQDWQDIKGFVIYSRTYEISISGVNKWLGLNASQIELNNLDDDSIDKQIIDAIVYQSLSWQTTAKELKLQGKKQAQSIFKQAVINAWLHQQQLQ